MERENSLPRGDDPLPVLVVEASLWRPAGKALTAGLLAVASDLPPLALGAGVRSGDALGTSVPVGFTSIGGISGGFSRSNSLDWRPLRQWAAPSCADGLTYMCETSRLV